MKVVFLHTTAIGRAAAAPQPVPANARRHIAKTSVERVLALVNEWRRRYRERAELARLDTRTLRDIGVSRADIWSEINKPFWRK